MSAEQENRVSTPKVAGDADRSDTDQEQSRSARTKRRRWKPLLLELLLWTALAVATAAFLVYASERWLPANF